MHETPTPECDKLVAASETSQAIGEFLDWMMSETPYVIGEFDEITEEIFPVGVTIEKLLAMYFEIDLDKVDQERKALLKEIRNRD